MNASVIASVIQILIHALGQSALFEQIDEGVHRWETRTLSGLEKKAGLVAELEVDGVKAAAWIVDTLIQLAVVKIRTAA
jgi:hypothetical protein